MSVDSMLNAALESTGLPVYPNNYTGDELAYLTWSYVELPALDAGDEPHAARYLITARYFLPHKQNPNAMKRAISRALFSAGCTMPAITPIGDAEGQGYAFECEWTDGGVLYGAD